MAGFVYRDINSLWHGGTAADWKASLDAYWQFIEPKFRDLEKRMDAFKPETIRPLDRAGWFQWLYEEFCVEIWN
jgi:hypothetical protein